MPRFSSWHALTLWPTTLDARWGPWLASEDSLTARLEHAMPAPLGVTVLNEAFERPHPDEQQRLGLACRRHVRVREVTLNCGDTPWVYARSLALPTARAEALLARMGRTPLGHWLFRQSATRRSMLEITTRDPLGVGALAGRRSVFQHPDITLLVQEFFLPAMTTACRLPTPSR
ncbi:chorismate--pyruvate lyase family protein [Larsenimonas salina]|uniref:chorismate--pyruvate lyase family protein n=1 Tax=Larsenimonas salina TaxID=1295565 RepID=UPI002073529A|nr:chorismate lyase [Larsenimonas salina]MCM5705680.1 chorismate lyase [Larsenimonas salina]